MALGEYSVFSWKSKATQEKEQIEYEKWAFPYGDKQREKLQALLLAVFPKDTVPTTLVPFLTCKELYDRALEKAEVRDLAIDIMINKQKSYKRIIKKKDMPTFLALVLADADIDENCEYPQADSIHERAREIEGRQKVQRKE